jgi:hypothetical protein
MVAVSHCGGAQGLFGLLDGRDVLIQFSVLELLEHVAATRRGTLYLFARYVLSLPLCLELRHTSGRD